MLAEVSGKMTHILTTLKKDREEKQVLLNTRRNNKNRVGLFFLYNFVANFLF